MFEPLPMRPEIAERFADLHPPLTAQAAAIEANRCLYCFDAPCTAACPTHIDVPRFIKKIANDNLRGSALAILDANILGASCSRVCPVQVLCEGACVMHHRQEPAIKIGLLQRHAMDAFYAQGAALPRRSKEERSERVACIGAGPASLACAAELRQRGYDVTVFDRRALPGGLNTYGVAEYKLRSADSLREIELVRSLGVKFKLDTEIGGEAALAQMEKEFDAIFLGVGLGAMRRLGVPGEDHPAVVDALTLIADYKTAGKYEVGRRVVVIGAGNTAIDAATAAKRLGAEDVSILYRRAEADISAFDFEYEHAKQEGVKFVWRAQPIAIHGDAEGLRSVECARVELDRDSAPSSIPGTNFCVECDMVVLSIGQSPLLEWLTQCRGVRMHHGRVVVDRATGQTANPKYYAGGDCVNGGREVVDAVADGKRAAMGIANALEVAHAGVA